jgi:Domain of unknown function (DUF3576)
MAWMRNAGVAGLAALTAGALAACSHGGMHTTKVKNAAATASIGVNGYLWRATLDTLSFMPLESADPWGGTVITEWYANPEKPDERFKATVYILDTRLRADGLKVTIYKQTKDASGQWVDAESSDQTETDIENAILTRARQLRLSNIGGKG